MGVNIQPVRSNYATRFNVRRRKFVNSFTIHSELSEALEEYRKGNPALYYKCGMIGEDIYNDACFVGNRPCGEAEEQVGGDCPYMQSTPHGIAVELADAIMRILDTCAYMGIDIDSIVAIKHAYNQTRPYRHGGKKI